ncbi:NADH-quinone oxidoreductase subunit N [Alloacidobacterium dinghuense]|uniref:NADH-quinone oxidoreductase subunit N n=1 Tax=Alloacidobacterium dinghuense TaxID=2763107 RepID=A0A7G8BLN9_9BACT|nr:NADH-quinone oxidoreductase subunit N [Alloacidobacterium dinghuense]QNI33459.1 NADH-quinone oxidoreductase subunit N [Alloacidobacterium dinghuense]
MNAHLAVSLPLMLMSATALAVMLAIAVKRNHLAAAGITLIGLGASFFSLLVAASSIPQQLGRLLIFDSYSLLYMALLLCAAAFVVLLSYNYLEQRHEHREEFYILILLATTGAMVLVASRHFISLFLGLELLSVSLYALISYTRSETISIEAGIKYLVLAASSSSVLLFGLALIYEESGSMDLSQLATTLNHTATFPLIAGLMLAFTGIGFKLAVVPFHLWTPDVYEGAPLPVTAFIATVSKGGMFALILRWLHLQNTGLAGTVGVVLSIIAIASMLTGNLLALTQTNIKRILAYSSIAHMGYALVALIAGGTLGAPAATYYLAAYFTTILGAFGVMTILSGPEGEAASIDDYRGLFWRRPILAAAFTAMLLSLAGIPLTAGFLGKFYVIAAGASQSRWVLLFTLIVSSTIGLFYYLRILAAMYAKTSQIIPQRTTMPVPATVALAVLTGLIFLLGLYPAPLWNAIVSAARTLG